MDNPITFKLQLPAEHRHLNVAGACVAAILERQPALNEPENVIYNVQLALQEACANIVNHAYSGQPGQIIDIAFELEVSPVCLGISLRDTGRSFNPDTVAEPDLNEVSDGGYSLFLMKQLMDEITYTPLSSGNHWYLVKNL